MYLHNVAFVESPTLLHMQDKEEIAYCTHQMMGGTLGPVNWRQVRGGSIKCNQETRHRTHHHMKPWAAALNDPTVKDLSSHTQRKTPQDLPNIMKLKNIIFSRIIQYLNKHAIIIILHHDLSIFSVLMYRSMGFNGFVESVPNWYKSQSSCKAQQRLAMDYHAQMVA